MQRVEIVEAQVGACYRLASMWKTDPVSILGVFSQANNRLQNCLGGNLSALTPETSMLLRDDKKDKKEEE